MRRLSGTVTEVNRAVALYALGREKEIFAFAGADISESLLFPIHAICSLHPAAFNWEVRPPRPSACVALGAPMRFTSLLTISQFTGAVFVFCSVFH